jgi:hypothetical protein
VSRVAPARSAIFLTAIAALACSGRAPPAPSRDTGPPTGRPDAGPGFDAGNSGLPGRPDGGPRLPSADRELVLRYFGDGAEEPLEVAGEVGTLDVFFSIDTTGSFGGEIDNLQADLRSRILPALRDRVEDVAFGVGRFEDFPAQPYGGEDDVPFRLMTAVTTDDGRVASAVAALDQPLGNGGDVPESGAEALWQIATGEGYGSLVSPYSGSGLGGVGFRSDALRVVVHVTDAPTHAPEDYGARFDGTHGVSGAVAALNELGVFGLGIASGEPARPYLEQVAVGTHAVTAPEDGVCRTGVAGTARPPVDGECPLVFDVREDGSGLADAVVDAITGLLATVRYDEVWAETDDAIGFVRTLEAVEAEPPDGVDPPEIADRRPEGDGVDDTFVGVRPGTRLSFRAVLRNEVIPPADYDQYFNLTLRVVGDGVTLLTKRIRVVVPRGRLDAGPPEIDAGSPPRDGGT